MSEIPFQVVQFPGLSVQETQEISTKWSDKAIDPRPYGFLSPFVPIRNNDYINIDQLELPDQDKIFKEIDKAIIVDFDKFFGPNNDPEFKFFILSSKRCYKNEYMRKHLVKYLNFFEKFHDIDHELIMIYYNIKYFMDYVSNYNEDNFIYDIKRYILFNESILQKIHQMNESCYVIELKRKKGKTIPNLQYDTKHGKILIQMSLLMNMVIPLITHFIVVKKMINNDLILKIFDIIINMSDVDMYSKLYETASYENAKSYKVHIGLWDKQDIRGKDTLTHTLDSINNIILNIIPKYRYDSNIISLNSSSIKNYIGFGILDIEYERNFKRLSSSNRDEDFNSELDKYEAYQIRQDANLALKNRLNAKYTMNQLDQMFNISDEEVMFYKNRLEEDGGNIYIPFQKSRIFNLFYRYYGDPISLYENNVEGYIRLMIMAKRKLLSYNMIILPYIISGKINKLSNRKNINQKERFEIEASNTWELIDNKYANNQKIKEQILGEIATIITSSFSYIDFYDKELDGKNINMVTTLVREEYLNYILLI